MNKASKGILAALAACVLASAGWILFADGGVEHPRVVIEVDGEVVYEEELGRTADSFAIETPDGEKNLVAFREDCVFMQSASCPDQICVDQGPIRDSSVPIVCLPHRVIVRIEGGAGELDAATQ